MISIGIGLAPGLTRRAGGFVGPYDAIPSITAAYGMRRLRSAYTGNILRLRRSSDNAELDFGYVANGDLDTAAIITWLGGASGFVVRWYDQSGNGNNATQATAASQPAYVASGQNGKPVVQGNGARWLNHTFAVGAKEKSILVAASANNQTGFRGIYSTHGNVSDLEFAMLSRLGTSPNWGTYRSPSEQPANTSVVGGGWKILEAIEIAAGSGAYYLNGASDGTFTASQGQPGNIFGSSAAAQLLSGSIAEIIVANVAWSTAQRQAAESAANTYWSLY